MTRLDLSLYLVLDPELCGGPLGMLRTAQVAACHGATIVQLRAPGWSTRAWLSSAAALKAVLDPLGVPLIINNHVDVALAADAAGVHVGQSDLPPELARRLLGPGKLLGLSITESSQLAGVPPSGVDYLGVGPVHATATKADAAPAMGLQSLTQIVRATALPVVAIGGLAHGRCGPALAAGAAGVAVISAICGQHDVASATKALREEIDAIARPASPTR